MEYFDFLLLFLNSNWKAIIATAGLFLSGYFAYQKVGNKITVNYHVGIEGYSDTQIVKLVLSNRKDKTVSIWGIDAVINQDIEFKLIDPEEPIILKSGESICLPIKKYSYLNVNGDRYKPEFFGNFEFYANLGNKRVRCQDEAINTDVKAQHNVATKTSVEFDGHLYNEKVRFILVYFLDGEKKIAFFEDNGFIGNEWSMSPNHMGSSDYKCEDIQKMLFQYGYHNMFTNYLCLENINLKKDLKLAFRK